MPDKPKIHTFVHHMKDTACVTGSFSTLLILHSVQGRQYATEQQKLPLDYCIYIPGQSQQVIALRKAYQAELKLPFSNEDNAEAKVKISPQGK